jgi:hypothetical protein
MRPQAPSREQKRGHFSYLPPNVAILHRLTLGAKTPLSAAARQKDTTTAIPHFHATPPAGKLEESFIQRQIYAYWPLVFYCLVSYRSTLRFQPSADYRQS